MFPGLLTAEIEELLDYALPSQLVAQQPAEPRDHSRLIVVNRENSALSHHHFRDLPRFLRPGDLLVLNDTRVIQARLFGVRSKTGGKWEGLFLREIQPGLWELLCQTRGRLLPGEAVDLDPGPLRLRLISKSEEGRWLASPEDDMPALELLQKHGHVPLPAYIRKGRARPIDKDRYQTVYACHLGGVAAPTAGLHFTNTLLNELAGQGIEWAFVTLHVGPGTFKPIEVSDYRQHNMHAEWGCLAEETAQAIERTKANGGRIVAVGTTSVRVLETVAATGPIRPWSGETDLYIMPPYPFRAVDALVTNFHLPRSTLLLLVAAFAGTDLVRRAYQAAVAHEYRFYSYGDAMFIV